MRIMPSEERKAYINVIDKSDLHKFILFFPSVCLFPCSMISTSFFLSDFILFYFFIFLFFPFHSYNNVEREDNKQWQ